MTEYVDQLGYYLPKPKAKFYLLSVSEEKRTPLDELATLHTVVQRDKGKTV